MDGAQARLKRVWREHLFKRFPGGKGGWGSGEIETAERDLYSSNRDGGKGGWGSGEIETGKGKGRKASDWAWKGWMGLRRD